MANRGTVAVPASVEAVQNFLDANRSRYVADLNELRALIEELRNKHRSMRCIYKVYSRGEKQSGEELKSSRKVRLKFNEHNLDNGKVQASLFDVPDIVGLTIVVPNPSDINTIASVLDETIRDKRVMTVPLPGASPGTAIKSEHGRPFETGGYFACHYNVRINKVSKQSPICEIQIKTLLHDAWGAKTHDLTYKPSGKIGAELLTSFELLGTNLANLDQQSDALRQTIMRSARVREVKRRKIQLCILSFIAKGRVDAVADPAAKSEFQKLCEQIDRLTDEAPAENIRPIADKLLDLFQKEQLVASTLLCLLAAQTQQGSVLEKALESIAQREEDTVDLVSKVHVSFQGALASFAAGDVAGAIDVAEDCHTTLHKLRRETGVDHHRLDRIAFSVCSDLAYYHADLIGSHEGDKRDSDDHAKRFLKQAQTLYVKVGLPEEGLGASNENIVAALSGATDPVHAFFALDNEAYVRIQTATKEDEVRDVWKRLDFLHSRVPDEAKEPAALARDYHDYCSRQRLSDLEGLTGA